VDDGRLRAVGEADDGGQLGENPSDNIRGEGAGSVPDSPSLLGQGLAASVHRWRDSIVAALRVPKQGFTPSYRGRFTAIFASWLGKPGPAFRCPARQARMPSSRAYNGTGGNI
jgi:hypothetical protein